MQFVYGGDIGCPIVSWFKARLDAIACTCDSCLPEAILTLLYSGIDTLGLLAASSGMNDATQGTFVDWCNNYILTRLKSVDGKSLTALDLYAARCGILHTSSSVSSLGRKGEAREICYQFKGQHGVNLALNAKLEPTMVDIEHLAVAFKEGGKEFLVSLHQDLPRLETARARAHFFRWANAVQL